MTVTESERLALVLPTLEVPGQIFQEHPHFYPSQILGGRSCVTTLVFLVLLRQNE